MEVKGVDKAELRRIVDLVSDQMYDGNIVVKTSANRHNSKGLRSSFTIKAVSSRMPGARRSWTGRRMPVACWHAHWHVLDRLFRAHPDAEVVTMYYRATAATFHERAAATARMNVGSAWTPVTPLELCDCDDDAWDDPRPIPAGANHPDRPAPKAVEPLEDRIAREIARIEADQAHWEYSGTAARWYAGDDD